MAVGKRRNGVTAALRMLAGDRLLVPILLLAGLAVVKLRKTNPCVLEAVAPVDLCTGVRAPTRELAEELAGRGDGVLLSMV